MVPAKKTNMAILFADSDYLEGFMSYIIEKDTGFSCFGFTADEHLRSYARENEIAVLLTDEASFEKGARHINSEMTIVLTERPGAERAEDVYTINILQPIDEIVREIMKTAAKMDITVSCDMLKAEGRLYTFFSPVGRTLKTTLAMAASQILSDREKTIYLNLEPDSGFSVLFRQEYDTDLSDLLFYLRDGAGERALMMLRGAICDIHGASFIPPVTDPGDLCQISKTEIDNLMKAICAAGYKNIVLDLGAFIPGLIQILLMSSRIFMPVRGDGISQAKTAQFFSYLRTLKDAPVEEKIERLELPFFKEVPMLTANMRGTRLGAYMESLL